MSAADAAQQQALLRAARQARLRAHAPYSGYRVGAALLTSSGRIISACNVENASLAVTVCAETAAVTKAISEGERSFVSLAVATENLGSPCGACRQVLSEFAPALKIICTDEAGQRREYELSELLPHGFGAAQIESPHRD